MPASEAIVLAGGLGTRIRPAVSDRPKPMAEIGGRPFLEYLLERMERRGISRAVLATGHMHDCIERHFMGRWASIEICYSIEDHPLGTGGAVWKAMALTSGDQVFIFNGDTFFDANLAALSEFHESVSADITLALKPMRSAERYGTVELDGARIVGFREKRRVERGLINGGVYLMNRSLTERYDIKGQFSLETDFLEQRTGDIMIAGLVQDGYFIDIGVPEDYDRAQRELPGLL